MQFCRRKANRFCGVSALDAVSNRAEGTWHTDPDVESVKYGPYRIGITISTLRRDNVARIVFLLFAAGEVQANYEVTRDYS